MREKEFFTRKHYNDITAATIGINKEDWYCYEPGMSQKNVAETMLLKNYDIVPILNDNDVCDGYYTLNKDENTILVPNKIEIDDTIYYLTHINDVIWQMKTTNKKFLFLSNGRVENNIVGFLSLSNFNSREFYIYLYSIISYIEREFAVLIESDKTNAFLILDEREQTKKSKDQLKGILNRIVKDENNNNENDFKEYLYLHHLIWLISEEKKFIDLKYTDKHEFEKEIEILRDLRNNIAHPVKSIVRNFSDLEELERGMNKLYEFKERIENYLEKSVSEN